MCQVQCPLGAKRWRSDKNPPCSGSARVSVGTAAISSLDVGRGRIARISCKLDITRDYRTLHTRARTGSGMPLDLIHDREIPLAHHR